MATEHRIELPGVGVKKGMPRMKKILKKFETHLRKLNKKYGTHLKKLKKYGTLLRPSRSVRNTGFQVLILVVLTFVLWQAHLVTGWQFPGLIAYLSCMLAIALFIWWLVLITSRSHASAKSHKVREALMSTLEKDDDPSVRSKLALGLVQLDKELSFSHHEHQKLDERLINVLQKDDDPCVRSKLAVGLAELTVEQVNPTYHQVHNKLDNMLFDEC